MQKPPSDQVWKIDNRQINRSNFTSGKVPKTYKSEERLSTQATVYIVAVNEESQLYGLATCHKMSSSVKFSFINGMV